ncbi:MAG: hypothetical protein JSV32_07715 [Dehalococcoidia bacterium]|nr:MAG: hypothetical protein JSV32_07715 [Dehalococcoidia bacterium]
MNDESVVSLLEKRTQEVNPCLSGLQVAVTVSRGIMSVPLEHPILGLIVNCPPANLYAIKLLIFSWFSYIISRIELSCKVEGKSYRTIECYSNKLKGFPMVCYEL